MIIDMKHFGDDAKELGENFVTSLKEGRKIDAIRELRMIGLSVHRNAITGDVAASIDLRTAKNFVEAVATAFVAQEKADACEKELALYKAFRGASFTVIDAITATKIAMGVLEK